MIDVCGRWFEMAIHWLPCRRFCTLIVQVSQETEFIQSVQQVYSEYGLEKAVHQWHLGRLYPFIVHVSYGMELVESIWYFYWEDGLEMASYLSVMLLGKNWHSCHWDLNGQSSFEVMWWSRKNWFWKFSLWKDVMVWKGLIWVIYLWDGVVILKH